MTVRAIFRAVEVESASSPYNILTMKVYYPAVDSDTLDARNTGNLPPNLDYAPYPVVIIMPGINVGPESYHWLAMHLASADFIVVTYSWITEGMPGQVGITPGIDLKTVTPNTYGKGPTNPALSEILADLEKVNGEGQLAGMLDMGTLIFGGHSAGGTVALQNANPDWFPQVKGVFTYAGHSMAATMLGFEAGTILDVAPNVAALLIGGTNDGVIAGSSHRYGLEEGSSIAAIQATYDAGLQKSSSSSLLLLDGANHFTVAYPPDETTGRGFIDFEETHDNALYRELIANSIVQFIRTQVILQQALNIEHDLVYQFQCNI